MIGWIIVITSIVTLLETTLTTLPFVLVISIVYLVKTKKAWVLFVAVSIGLLLDLVAFRALGTTSFFYIVFLFLIMQYERKYQIDSPMFVTAVCLLGGLLFALLVGYPAALLHGVMSGAVGIIFYYLMSYLETRQG